MVWYSVHHSVLQLGSLMEQKLAPLSDRWSVFRWELYSVHASHLVQVEISSALRLAFAWELQSDPQKVFPLVHQKVPKMALAKELRLAFPLERMLDQNWEHQSAHRLVRSKEHSMVWYSVHQSVLQLGSSTEQKLVPQSDRRLVFQWELNSVHAFHLVQVEISSDLRLAFAWEPQ